MSSQELLQESSNRLTETTLTMENETIPKKATLVVPPLPLVEEPNEIPKRTDVIEFVLKQRAGSTATAPTYKLTVARFCEGTVAEWIDFRKAIAELWRQNGITNPQDRIATIANILRGDSLTAFYESIQEQTTSVDDAGLNVVVDSTEETVFAGLNAVALTVFPFRALESQKQWMRRRMQKPKDLSIRKTVAAVGRLNQSLTFFPNGKESDKFTTGEILEILEWSIPEAWRTKFDLNGYIPTEFPKSRFITECEAIERNEPKLQIKTDRPLSEETKTHKKSHDIKYRSANNDTTAMYHCTEHGHNHTHSTEKCYTLKNREEKASGTSSSGLSKKSFRKEINSLAKGKPRKKILEMFQAVLQKEQKRLSKSKKSKKKKVIIESSSESSSSDSSDEEMSIQHMELNKIDKTDINSTSSKLADETDMTDETDEDKNYLARIQNLEAITNEE